MSCLYYVTVFMLFTEIAEILRLILHAPRPFWVKEQIKSYECLLTFGNPSATTLYVTGYYLILWLDYNKNCNHSSFYKRRYKCVYLLAYLLVTGSFAVIRFTLGLESVL